MSTPETSADKASAMATAQKTWETPRVSVVLPASVTQGPPGGGKGGGNGPNGS